MTITGTIIQALPQQSGISKSGNNWVKQEYLLETLETYPKTVCFAVMGDAIDKLNIQTGQLLDVSIDISSREYNGRWYTSVTAWAAKPHQEPMPNPNDFM